MTQDAAALDAAPKPHDEAQSQPPTPLLRRYAATPAFYMAVVLVLLIAFFSAVRPATFPSVFNARNILLDASTLLVVSTGMTYVMIAGGFDLSVGSVLVFAGVAAAQVMDAVGGNGIGIVLLGLIAALAAGLAWGLFNGFCVAYLRVPPLITTLGSMGAALGIADLMTGGNDIRTVPDGLIAVGSSDVGGIPVIVVIAAVVTLIGGIWLHMTRFGTYTYIVGSNAEAGRRAGINVPRHLLILYGLSGLLAGLAGILSLGRFATTTIEGHTMEPLQSITAVVLGGTSLFGGMGSAFGTVIGVFLPAVLENGFVIMDVQPFWQAVVIGFVVIAAVYLDQLARRRRERA
jgi:ribose transport system permease protein